MVKKTQNIFHWPCFSGAFYATPGPPCLSSAPSPAGCPCRSGIAWKRVVEACGKKFSELGRRQNRLRIWQILANFLIFESNNSLHIWSAWLIGWLVAELSLKVHSCNKFYSKLYSDSGLLNEQRRRVCQRPWLETHCNNFLLLYLIKLS